MNCQIDHLLWTVPDLETGMRAFEDASGVTPIAGGEHPNMGTHNALVSLGPRCYLEIIAARPGTPPSDHPLIAKMLSLPGPGLATFAVSGDLDLVNAALTASGHQTVGPDAGSRQTPEGETVQWRNLMSGGHDLGAVFPFFIDWLDTPHPGATSPQGCTLVELMAISPATQQMIPLVAQLGLDLKLEAGPANGLIALIDTPRGRITLTGSALA